MKKRITINDDTMLSDLFDENYHNELRTIIDSFRPHLLYDDPNVDALALNNYVFDYKKITAKQVYMMLIELIEKGALLVTLKVFARFLFDRSNLSRTYSTLYVLMTRYRTEWWMNK
jgi:hypothetical protein